MLFLRSDISGILLILIINLHWRSDKCNHTLVKENRKVGLESYPSTYHTLSFSPCSLSGPLHIIFIVIVIDEGGSRKGTSKHPLLWAFLQIIFIYLTFFSKKSILKMNSIQWNKPSKMVISCLLLPSTEFIDISEISVQKTWSSRTIYFYALTSVPN